MECPVLLYLVENQSQNSSIATFLRNQVCGHENDFPYYPKVCCPFSNESDSKLPDIYETVSSRKLPSQDTCGWSEITHYPVDGGNTSVLGAWPWIAALGYLNLNMENPAYEWMCAGSLISDRFVITAAHCTIGIGMYRLQVVRLGDLNLNPNIKDEANPIDVPISLVIRHNQYNAEDLTSDIALLKLAYSVSFDRLIQPICLPILSNHRANNFVESDTYLAGWGSTMLNPSYDALIDVQLQVVKNSLCQRGYLNKSIYIDDRHLCAGIFGTDVCRGDSGGPLMWKSGSQYYLVGVVNFGHTNCAEVGYPGVYARVTSFVQWITDTMNYN
ncbi:venom protease-like isoform X2 [Metopolophium dirhodum]|nr:venom protease-like isoform X2 [Metopolophium dirhodum]XP_060870726.1 venom protease-like isoform X2 [Metopolophium dirhodum]XP_060871500.1 venom protease-like isoform X2 [Metopolophium dirhodum]XP_060871501.1 venom protease-like isoform X2 [Metopolophium dirhodum]